MVGTDNNVSRRSMWPSSSSSIIIGSTRTFSRGQFEVLAWTKKHPWLALALCIVALCAVLSMLSLFVQITPHLCTYNQHTNKDDCAPHHLGPFIGLWVILFADTHNGLITAIATALLTGITYMLVQVTRHQSENSKQQLRAYVFVENVFIADGPTPPLAAVPSATGCPSSRVVIKNSGQTPAHEVRHLFDILLVPAISLNAPVFPSDATVMASTPVSFGTNGITNLDRNLGRVLTPGEIAALVPAAMALVVVGKIIYQDVFGDEHVTEYNLGWAGQYPPPIGPNMSSPQLIYLAGNRFT